VTECDTGRLADRLGTAPDNARPTGIGSTRAESQVPGRVCAHNGRMRRRTLRAQTLAGAVVAVLLAVAFPVVVVGITQGTAAIRAGAGVRAAQAGLVALLAAVVGVVALATYAHWLYVTERPRRPHRRHVPTRLELALVGLLVVVLGMGASPVLLQAYSRSLAAYRASDLSWAVGYGILGAAYIWFVLFSVQHYVHWVRHEGRRRRGRGTSAT
jgi:hypothetical protein